MIPIEVFVRHCFYSPNADAPNRSRPEWFHKERCWSNLKYTLRFEDHIGISVIYDNHFGPINNDLYNGKFDPNFYKKISVHEINCGTEAESFLAMLDIIMAKNLPDETIIYMVEDDYLHLRGWPDILREGIATGAQYVTLYDHADKYQLYPDLRSRILVTESTHWRTTPSTTNTYACTMAQLRKDIDIHRKYSLETDNKITRDNEKFLALGALGRTLISPMPGWSTHCDGNLSPIIKWDQI